jgi:hypothetical protein
VRKRIMGVFIFFCLCAFPAAIENADMARAKEAITKYMREKYAWNERRYEILIAPYIHSHKSELGPHSLPVLLFHHADREPPSSTGGLSFTVEFDWKKMAIQQEWHSQ